jgi:hypothetical protein
MQTESMSASLSNESEDPGLFSGVLWTSKSCGRSMSSILRWGRDRHRERDLSFGFFYNRGVALEVVEDLWESVLAPEDAAIAAAERMAAAAARLQKYRDVKRQWQRRPLCNCATI